MVTISPIFILELDSVSRCLRLILGSVSPFRFRGTLLCVLSDRNAGFHVDGGSNGKGRAVGIRRPIRQWPGNGAGNPAAVEYLSVGGTNFRHSPK